MTEQNQSKNIFFSSLIALGLLASVLSCSEVQEPPVASKRPIIFDTMTFRGKPDLGLSQELHFISEWAVTLRDEGKWLTEAGSNKTPSAHTIEPFSLKRVVQPLAGYKYLVIDIESLHANEDPIAIRYVELAKKAAPYSKVSWWNLGPLNVVKSQHRPFDQEKWQAKFDKRKALVEASDFCILGSYFRSDDTVETWQTRHVPRIAEARRLYGVKPIFVTLSPHYFDKGRPWPFVSGKLLGEAMDTLAVQQVDGIVLWSYEGTGTIKQWDEHLDWVRAVRIRTDYGGRYKPILSQ